VLIGKWLGYRVAERDPKAQRDSFEAFKELTTRFPDSKYAPDALARMRWLVEVLAQHEIAVARFYFERSAYLAAIERAQGVIRDFPATPSIEDALLLMSRAYGRLGLKDLQDDTDRVLERSFPRARSAADSILSSVTEIAAK
jgi:outer membrane protein assembly factor BamD